MATTPHLSSSPFVVREEDACQLRSNRAFQIVREFMDGSGGPLSNNEGEKMMNKGNNIFCSDHTTLPNPAKETFIFHRDILHALILPLLQIHTQAARHAATLLKTPDSNSRSSLTNNKRHSNSNLAHLELAFRGNARGAFSWLQCFVAEERAWCATRGCPACVVLHTMSAEPTIRVCVVASRLSETLQRMFEDFHRGDESGEGKQEQQDRGPKLPGLGFWEACLKDALERDEFWGEGYWEEIEARATDLEHGLKELIDECLHPRPHHLHHHQHHHLLHHRDHKNGLCVGQQQQASGRRAVSSGFAQKQMSLVKEEQQWMQKVVLACWSTLLAEAARERMRVFASRRLHPTSPRSRSLTT